MRTGRLAKRILDVVAGATGLAVVAPLLSRSAARCGYRWARRCCSASSERQPIDLPAERDRLERQAKRANLNLLAWRSA